MTSENFLRQMNELQTIQSKMYEIRGQRVMLDRDLAALYGVETKVLNQAVKRNIKRFEGDDFMFRLTKDETAFVHSKSQIVTLNSLEVDGGDSLRSQIVTTKVGRGGSRYLPYAFTELGVAMLSSVLKSDTAINVNREIMRVFVELRRFASSLPVSNTSKEVAQLRKDFEELKLDIEDILRDQNDINESTRSQIDAISTALAELQAKDPKPRQRRRIGFIQDETEEK